MRKLFSVFFAFMIVFSLTVPVMAAQTEITVEPEETNEEGTVTLTAKTFGSGAFAIDCWIIGEEEVCMADATLEKVTKDEFDMDLPEEEQYWLSVLVWTAPVLGEESEEVEFTFTYKIALYSDVTEEKVETDAGKDTAEVKVKKVNDETDEQDDQDDEEEEVVEPEYPAAPAIATKLLALAGVSHRYGKGKDGGNYISDVAKLMGKGASFRGVEKKDFTAYAEAVKAYLIEVGALEAEAEE